MNNNLRIMRPDEDLGDWTAEEEMKRRRTSWDGIDQAEATRRLETAQLPADEGPAPRAAAGGGGGFKLMDVPEGAQIRRTVSMQGEDGSKDQTVASWIHSPAKPAALEQPGRFERLERQKAGMGGSQEARAERLQYQDRFRMMDAGRQDKMAGDDANRLTQETLEAIKGGSQVAGNQATATGMRLQGSEAAGIRANADLSVAAGARDVQREALQVEREKAAQAPKVFEATGADGQPVKYVYLNGQIQRVDATGRSKLAGEALKDEAGRVVGYRDEEGKPTYFEQRRVDMAPAGAQGAQGASVEEIFKRMKGN
jgi:hypothetical protein